MEGMGIMGIMGMIDGVDRWTLAKPGFTFCNSR
jgi:hypothetical protein